MPVVLLVHDDAVAMLGVCVDVDRALNRADLLTSSCPQSTWVMVFYHVVRMVAGEMLEDLHRFI